MSRNKKNLVEDVEFVFNECARLQKALMSGLSNVDKDDLWFEIPSPDQTRGSLMCGQAAERKLVELAEEAGYRGGILNRVDITALRNAIAEQLVQRFLRDLKEINPTEVDRAISASASIAQRDCVDIRHWVPCHLMRSKDPDELHIGPVKFRNRSAFRRVLLEHLSSYSRAKSDPDATLDRQIMLQAIRYYRSFDWVAEVKIDRCDAPTSETLAERAVISALDCLHLILQARWTDQMRVGGPAIKRDRRAKLTISADNSINVSVSYSGAGQVNYPDGWAKELETPDFEHLFSICGIALEAAVDPDLKRPLSRRFLDAAQWFGEASRDESAATRVVKYVTAIERMVMTKKEKDITSAISERVSAICFDPSAPGDREAWRVRARDAYDIRSQLVHGALSPREAGIRAKVELCAELAEMTLLRTASALSQKGLSAEKVSPKQFTDWFKEMVARADILAPASGEGSVEKVQDRTT